MLALIFKYYVHKHIHISTCLVLFYLYQAETSSYAPDHSYVYFLFFSVITVYNIHAIPRGEAWLDYIKSSPILFIGLLGFSTSFIFLSSQVQFAMFPLGFVTALYILPVFPKRRKLRDFPFIKIFILSLVLTFMVVTLPGWIHNMDNMVLLMMTSSRFLFFFALCLLFDIKDFEKDQRFGVQTFATYFSLRKLKFLGIFLSIILFVNEIYLANHFIIDIENMAAMTLAIFAIALYFSRITYKSRTTLFSFLCDGIIALPFFTEFLIH